MIVFGSEYRTAPGHIQPGTSAQHLLDGGPIAVALAPAGLKDVAGPAISSIAVVGEEGDPGPRETAESLAAALGAELALRADDGAGLVVIGSKPGTAAGRVALSAAAQYLIEMLPCPVLALPHRDWPAFLAAGARAPERMRAMSKQREIRSWLMDMDGVLVRENHAIPGADRFPRAPEGAAAAVPGAHEQLDLHAARSSARLRGSGLDMPEEAIWTSALATAELLEGPAAWRLGVRRSARPA